MAKMIKFLGQSLLLGEYVGDIVGYDSRIVYDSPPSYFDPIRYMRNNGGIPRTDHSYLFYDESTGDDYPVFGIYVFYTAGLFRVGYCMRSYDNDGGYWYPWNPGSNTLVMRWADGYAGADPDNIKDEDTWRNGLFILYCNIAGETPGGYPVGSWGFSIGHEIYPDEIATGEPATGSYEYSDDYLPHRYINLDIYTSYSITNHWYEGISFPRYGYMWMSGVMQEVDDVEEDTSGPAGGYGTYQFPSDTTGHTQLPSLSIIDSGIATMWTPSPAQVRSFVDFLWSDDFFDNIIKLVADPLENIIQFGVVPFDLSSYEDTAKEVKVGNVSTGVTMSPLTKQYIVIDMGSISIPEAFGNCLDYNNTKVSIFLPFVGTFDLTADEVMNSKSIHLWYNVDLLTGDFMAELYINKNMPLGDPLNNLMYCKSGNLMTKLPLTGANYGRTYGQILSGAAQTIGGAITGNFGGASAAAAGMVMNAASQPVERTGAFTGNAAALGHEHPYIILTQPCQVFPPGYGEYEGYALYDTYTLNNLHGFTKVYSVIDNTIGRATDDEQKEIEMLLKEGIFLPPKED